MLFNLCKTGALMAVISTLAVAAPTARPSEVIKRDNNVPGCHDQAFIDAALAQLNHHRNIHGSANLTWDHDVAEYAQNYVDKCIFEHSGGPYGENLFSMGPAPDQYLGETSQAIYAWAREIWDYDFSKPGQGMVLHATALLWRSTTKVGCAWQSCNNTKDPNGVVNGAIFMCNFADSVPNMGGEYQDNVFPLGTPIKDA